MDLDKFNAGVKICDNVLSAIIQNIENDKIFSILGIASKGDSLILESLQSVYKNSTKSIGFPVSISINNCVENSRKNATLMDYDNCIVKIKLGTNIDGCISLLSRTFKFTKETGTLTQTDEIRDIEEKCKKICEKNMFNGNTNDEVRKLIEIELLQRGYQTIENCISYQTFENHLSTSESKYMILNYTKYYDENDELIEPTNNCFEFLNGEVYHVNIYFVSNENDDYCLTTCKDNSDMYRLNEYYYSLKTKSGRTFYNLIQNNHGTNPFVYENYTNQPINKIGFKECYDNGILTELPILHTKDNINVYGFIFSIVISNKRGIILK